MQRALKVCDWGLHGKMPRAERGPRSTSESRGADGTVWQRISQMVQEMHASACYGMQRAAPRGRAARRDAWLRREARGVDGETSRDQCGGLCGAVAAA